MYVCIVPICMYIYVYTNTCTATYHRYHSIPKGRYNSTAVQKFVSLTFVHVRSTCVRRNVFFFFFLYFFLRPCDGGELAYFHSNYFLLLLFKT